MSGGHFDYRDSALKDTIFDYADKPSNQFEDLEISYLVWDMLDLIHAYDWYRCSDTDHEDWIKAKQAFKQKWLKSDRTTNLEAIIDDRLSEVRDELKEMISSDNQGSNRPITLPTPTDSGRYLVNQENNKK